MGWGWDVVGDLAVPAACASPGEQSSHLDFCSFLQRHFCVFALSFPGQEALLAVYSTILAQHLALQKMPPAVQKLQPQLVAAALGEPLPHRGDPGAPGSTSTPRHRANEPFPPIHAQSTASCPQKWPKTPGLSLQPKRGGGESEPGSGGTRGCGGLGALPARSPHVSHRQLSTRKSPPPSCQQPSSSTTSSTSATSPTYSR